jgi:hypothetical protein
MEIVGFLVLLFDRDERRHNRDGYRNTRNRASQRRYPDDDWDDEFDDHYPYNPYWPPPYPHPRRRRRGSTGLGILLGFLFAVVLVSLVAAYAWNGQPAYTTFPPRIVPVSGETTKGLAPRVADYDEVPEHVDPKPLLPPKEVYEVLTKPHMIRLTITDSLTFKSIKSKYPTRNIEAFRDKDQRYWVCIFAQTSQELDEIVNLLRLREDDLTENGLGITYYPISKVCSGQIVRVKGTDIWFCQA